MTTKDMDWMRRNIEINPIGCVTFGSNVDDDPLIDFMLSSTDELIAEAEAYRAELGFEPIFRENSDGYYNFYVEVFSTPDIIAKAIYTVNDEGVKDDYCVYEFEFDNDKLIKALDEQCKRQLDTTLAALIEEAKAELEMEDIVNGSDSHY